jgi:hypothetical protein
VSVGGGARTCFEYALTRRNGTHPRFCSRRRRTQTTACVFSPFGFSIEGSRASIATRLSNHHTVAEEWRAPGQDCENVAIQHQGCERPVTSMRIGLSCRTPRRSYSIEGEPFVLDSGLGPKPACRHLHSASDCAGRIWWTSSRWRYDDQTDEVSDAATVPPVHWRAEASTAGVSDVSLTKWSAGNPH